MISGWGIKTTRACAPVAPPSLAPLHMILVKFLILKKIMVKEKKTSFLHIELLHSYFWGAIIAIINNFFGHYYHCYCNNSDYYYQLPFLIIVISVTIIAYFLKKTFLQILWKRN